MKFKKLSEDKFRCFISKEEMDENGIDISEFMTNQASAQAFIHDVVDQACHELNIKTSASSYSVQMMVDNNGDIVLTVTAQELDIMETLAMLKESLGNLKESLDHDGNTNKVTAKDVSLYSKVPFWLVLSSIEMAIKLAKEVKDIGVVESELYRYKDYYYMSMLLCEDKFKASHIILHSSELSLALFTETFDGAFLKEHGKLICKDAVSILSQI